MSDRLQRSMALMDAKADVKMIKERANECWYDTKILANAVCLILEELTATDTVDTPQTDLLVKTPQKSRDSHEVDTPQTDAEITELAKEIVHKMIDNSDIAEDTYPDLRQRMHEAVERLGEYYPSEDERRE